MDVGQTVQSSMNVATFFVVATDLTHLKLTAGVDEADIGKVRPDMDVSFTVDSYPTQTFHGTVNAVRLNATTQNNVVTYPVWIDVPNPDLKLRPSMTAQVKIIVRHGENVVRVPNQAAALQAERGHLRGARASGAGRGPGSRPRWRERQNGGRQRPGRGRAGCDAASGGRGQRRRVRRTTIRRLRRRPVLRRPQPAGASATPAPSGQAARRRRTARPMARAHRTARTAANRNRTGRGGGGAGANGGTGFGNSGNMSSLTPEQRQAMTDRYSRGGGAGGRGGGRGNRRSRRRTS